jgi:hypothetical protein
MTMMVDRFLFFKAVTIFSGFQKYISKPKCFVITIMKARSFKKKSFPAPLRSRCVLAGKTKNTRETKLPPR